MTLTSETKHSVAKNALSADALKLAHWLAGEFSSLKKNLEEPRIYPHVRVYFRPLSFGFFNGIGFYSEEIYDYDPWHPLHQNVYRMFSKGDQVYLENYSLKDPDLHTGAGKDSEILSTVTPNCISLRQGCAMVFKRDGNMFRGGVEPGNCCLIPCRDGRMTYLFSKVEVTEESWASQDVGLDVDTHEKVWGSILTELLYFEKVQDYSSELPSPNGS